MSVNRCGGERFVITRRTKVLRAHDGSPRGTAASRPLVSEGTALDRRRPSLRLSLANVYETFAISFPTILDAFAGRVTKEVCDTRLERWSRNIVANARITLEVEGREHMRAGETYLVMSNHRSLYDIPVLFQVVGPNIRMITKKELFRVPVFGGALAAGGFIAIDRSNRREAIRSLDRARELLASGTHVWIAPEGTRSRTREMLPFKKGAFYLAMEASLPILPVLLDGTEQALEAKGVRSAAGARVRVRILPRVDPRPYVEMGKGGRDRLMADLRRTMEAAL
jgi:1-acyl-sn-glycerol-3-phosphate acyltransferase